MPFSLLLFLGTVTTVSSPHVHHTHLQTVQPSPETHSHNVRFCFDETATLPPRGQGGGGGATAGTKSVARTNHDFRRDAGSPRGLKRRGRRLVLPPVSYLWRTAGGSKGLFFATLIVVVGDHVLREEKGERNKCRVKRQRGKRV